MQPESNSSLTLACTYVGGYRHSSGFLTRGEQIVDEVIRETSIRKEVVKGREYLTMI